MKPTPGKIKHVLELLRETPDQITSITEGMTFDQLCSPSEKKSWSATEVLAHLRSCADLWGSDIDRMLQEDNPSYTCIHPRNYIKMTNYPRIDFHQSLLAFKEQREGLINLLKDLTLESWSRGANINGRSHTVFSQARRMALHEEKHWDQFKSIKGKIAAQQQNP